MMTDLPDRAVLRLTGEDASPWFANIVTCDIAGLHPGQGRWGALLTPQGKILFDFLATTDGQAIYLDTDRARAADFARRLGFYRLRARVRIEDLSADWFVRAALEESDAPSGEAVSFADPRHPELGRRILATGNAAGDQDAFALYHARRIALAIPEAGKDFEFGEAFPHEALMDMLGGVDFRKGCYVGQEVVSRMQHRGTARTRIVPVTGNTSLPSRGTDIRVGEKSAGTLGSTSGPLGLAMLRLDRLEEGLAQGLQPMAGEIFLEVSKPEWWTAQGR